MVDFYKLCVSNLIECSEQYGFWITLAIATIGFFIPILTNPQKLKDFFEVFSYIRKGSIRDKEKALESSYLDPLTRQSIQKLLSEDHFYQATGLRVNYYFRHVLLALCEYSQGEITLYNIKKSILNLSYKNSKLEISISKFERILGRISFLIFILSIVSAIIVIFYIVSFLIGTGVNEGIIKDKTIFLTAIFYILLMMASSFVTLNSYLELKNSEKIEKYLKENSVFNDEHLTKYPFLVLTVDQGYTGSQGG